MPRNLNPSDIHELAEEITVYVAYRIAEAIDAGSERDAVMEDLQSFFLHYVAGWSNEPRFTEDPVNVAFEKILHAINILPTEYIDP